MQILPLGKNLAEPQEKEYSAKELIQVHDQASKAHGTTENKLEFRLKVLPRTGLVQKRPPPMGVIPEDDE